MRNKFVNIVRQLFVVVLSIIMTGSVLASENIASAARDANWDQVQSFLQQGEDVNTPLNDGSTALIWTTYHDNLGMIQRLLDAGANVNTYNRYGISALYNAALNASSEAVALLVDHGADIGATQRSGETPLMTAVYTGDVEVVRTLIQYGADVNQAESFLGQTPLMWAASKNYYDIVELLLENGAEVDTQSRRVAYDGTEGDDIPRNMPAGGMTALLFASRDGAYESLELLLNYGANPNIRNYDEFPAMNLAILNQHYDITELLYDYGADPNLADAYNRTPLFAAVWMRRNPYSTRPYHLVHNENTVTDVVHLLLSYPVIDVDKGLTGTVPRRGSLDTTDRTLGNGGSPLMWVIRTGDMEMFDILLEAGADPFKMTTDGVTTLMIASGTGWGRDDDFKIPVTLEESLAMTQRLIDMGLDVNARDNNGRTALHGALPKGDLAAVRALIEAGADVCLADNDGKIPLQAALTEDYIEEPVKQLIGELTLQAGCEYQL